MKCEKIISNNSRREPKTCGRSGTRYVLKGALTSVPATLCDRHSSAFASEGYSLERLVTDVAPVSTVAPVVTLIDKAPEIASICSLTTTEPQAAPPNATQDSAIQPHGGAESVERKLGESCGEAASETEELGIEED